MVPWSVFFFINRPDQSEIRINRTKCLAPPGPVNPISTVLISHQFVEILDDELHQMYFIFIYNFLHTFATASHFQLILLQFCYNVVKLNFIAFLLHLCYICKYASIYHLLYKFMSHFHLILLQFCTKDAHSKILSLFCSYVCYAIQNFDKLIKCVWILQTQT